MIIPPYIKRRVIVMDYHLTEFLTTNPHFLVSEQLKEEYLESISRGLSEWFILTYDYRSDELLANFWKRVKELIPVIKYLIRTKVILHWEQMNEVKL
jgi:hypothetical protein